jgi:hypothetical protein
MTQKEWLACTDPEPMLDLLHGMNMNRLRLGRRKLRLFGCACCHRVWRLLTRRGRRWLDLAERVADRMLRKGEYRHPGQEELGEVDGQNPGDLADQAAWFALGTNVMIAASAAARSAAGALEMEARLKARTADNALDGLDQAFQPEQAVKSQESSLLAALLRCIFGNPFRRLPFPGRDWLTWPTLNIDWLTWGGCTVPLLARTIYAQRAFDQLPVLADTLEEAGCNKAEILAHCRGAGPHVRGCWVLDLIV